MKVGNNSSADMLAAKVQQNVTQHAQQAKNGTAAEVVQQTRTNASGVPVTVSNSARTLDQSGKAFADVDMAKVNAMRAAIANGSFKVDASAIAEKLLTNTVELLGAKGA